MIVGTRILRPDEYHRLRNHPWLREDRIPLPVNSVIVVAEEGEEIVGFWVAQVIVTCEPVWIKKEKRFQGIAQKMWNTLKETLVGLGVKNLYTHASRPGQVWFLKHCGFTPTTETVMKGEF